MFQLNSNLEVKTEVLQGSIIYTIDNFYKDPEEVSDYIFNREVPLWKINQKPSYNSVYFNDRRLIKIEPKLLHVYIFLSRLCKMKYADCAIFTNMTRFFRNDFNDYGNCFWWPHLDIGYNAVVYFNKDEENSGTNLYDQKVLDDSEWESKNADPEHYLCWRPKEKYSVIKTFKSKYNSLCLFDGSKFPHGMNITNDIYFSDIPLMSDSQVGWDNYRCNQAFFFKEAGSVLR